MQRTALVTALCVIGGISPAAAQLDEACADGTDWPQRVEACMAAIDGGSLSDDDLIQAYDSLCRSHVALGAYDVAVAACDQAIAANPNLAGALSSRGIAHGNLGNHQLAIADFDAVLQLVPDNESTKINRAVAQNQLAWEMYLGGEAAGGLPLVNAALEIVPAAANFLDTRGHIHAALDQNDAALADFEAAMEAGGGDYVRQYQQALTGHGHNPGPIDGAYGPGTRAALVACLEAGCRLLE